MSLTNQTAQLPKIARQIFRDATVTSIGQNFHDLIIFHLEQKFNRDPYEVLMSDPQTFYNGLEKILGAGAKAVITLVATFLTTKYDINCTSKEFVELFTTGEETLKQRVSEIFENISTENKRKRKHKRALYENP